MADVNNWFDGEDDGVNAWADGVEGASPGGEAGVVYLGPLPGRVLPNEPLTITAHVADAIGNPVTGATVTLVLGGVAYTGTTAGETVAGTVAFEITPTEEGTLSVQATSGDLESQPAAVEIVAVLDPMAAVISRLKGRRRGKRPSLAELSYLDVGPIAAEPAQPAGLTPTGGLNAPAAAPQPGMNVLAQHLGQLVADQEAKLAAEAQAMQQDLM
ncbi:MAG: Ig-like domain repeat protein [Steroidobacteraceae bacterium]|nr:Ig-like domain repeat protein [Steroidobacteraceae bacterium]